ncbi:cobalamin-binding protein [Parashewanella curva]|uniref:Cobalamin-binding protein n=1 Tax=Parashewanella curva TaxID=2338552 RepID=A0A3L8PUT1_9GAMM|nr:cobalamin-binding protein [Parashewanella curva]RLV59064.1 cobalamin-binding protein [Parashewanella curva]
MKIFPLIICSLVLLSLSATAKSAKRIIALSPHAVEQLFAIGAGDSIVAAVDHADFPEQAKKIPSIGGYHGIQLERVLELDPDLIVVWGKGNKPKDIERLKQLGFNLYDSSPSTLTAIATDLLKLGELTGHQQQAKKVVTQFRQQLSKIRSKNEKKQKVKVFYQLWSKPLMTVAKNSWIQQLISVCNGDNVFYSASSDYPQVSIENVLLAKPEVILQSQDEGNIQGIDWSKWPSIPAVKHHQIYQLDADLLHRPTPRAIDGIKLVCGALDKARSQS